MKIFGLVFPKGLAFVPRPGGMWDGVHESVNNVIVPEVVSSSVKSGKTWDARQAIDIDSLADEYGAELFRAGDETLYREYLRTFIVKDIEWHSQADRVQQLLLDSGFGDVVVVKNNNLADPRRWTQQTPMACCGNKKSVCGNATAICGYNGYGVLANWPMKNDAGLNNGFPIDANIAGVDISELYGSVIFICKSVTYDGSGNIVSMVPVQVSKQNYERFELAILRGMPSDCIAVLIAEALDTNIISETGYAWEDIISQQGLQSEPIISQLGV